MVCLVLLGATYLPSEARAGAADPKAQQAEQQAPPAAEQKPAPAQGDLLIRQSQEDADSKTNGCLSCHTKTDSMNMHSEDTVRIGCVDCHGGDASVSVAAGAAKGSPGYEEAEKKAHVQPRNKENARTSANPVRVYSKWLDESWEFIKFVNPGDLRVARKTCGRSGCHSDEVRNVRTSMMTHGAMLWEAGLYNNGGYAYKNARFGESYGEDGKPQRLITFPPPTPEETRLKGVLPLLDPLFRWEVSQPGNVLRVFERGGREKGEIGIPNPEDASDAGRPDVKLSPRGFGTDLRTDPVFLGLQKTRLLDPLLSFPGTNDNPGDFRHSGCSGCHVVYANDRDRLHSGPFAKYGLDGKTATIDPTISKTESGHPIVHAFTKAIPSSQCMVCHVHPGTNMVTTYYGYTWWDNEMDGGKMYDKEQHDPTEAEYREVRDRNPEGSAARGKWRDVEFLKGVGTEDFNKDNKFTQFADFHSHGWIFRAVFKHDRKGTMLDADDKPIDPHDPDKLKKAVHLADIHLEKGMHCIDCHFEQDNHGNGKLYGETRNAVEVQCESCHGDVNTRATLLMKGPAAPDAGHNLKLLRTPWKEERFFWRGNKLYQRSAVEQGKIWEVVQVVDTITPGNDHYSEKSRLAKTIQKDGKTWGAVFDEGDLKKLAHSSSRMTCQSCHTSWTTSCFGCHLSMEANARTPMLHNEGLTTKNWTAYDFMVLRDDVYMLGIDGTVTGHRVSPVRSACAIIVSSRNTQRDWLYYQQQTISTEGFSGQAFSPYVPHTVRAKETKQCTDCHVSSQGDNNAWMAQLTIQGTNFVNFFGRYVYTANTSKGISAVAVAEHDEPPAIIGSDFHKLAYPKNYEEHEKHKLELDDVDEHPVRNKLGGEEVLDVQMRGEYLYAAMGKGGYRIFDIAQIDNKDFSEKITTAPVSPFGQRLYVKSKYATAIATPTTLGVDPLRKRFKENEEQPIHLIFGFLYGTDKYEGLIVIGNANPKWKNVGAGVGTLLDGDPKNNFLGRAVTFNPDGILNGARRITIVGVYAYILCDKGLVVVSLDDPLHPKVTQTIGAPELVNPTGVQVQFRYGFITDSEGLKVLDVTHLDKPVLVSGAVVPLKHAKNVYTARTFAYVSDGEDGIAIVDIEKPEHPVLDQMYNAEGELHDVHDVKIGMVSSSQFAFVADGKHGFKVLQLFSPVTNDDFLGFSPKPHPKLVSKAELGGETVAVSEGVDRDRAVDESGNQLAVFGRRGARPFTKEEIEKLYLRDGEMYTVTDDPPGPAQDPRRVQQRAKAKNSAPEKKPAEADPPPPAASPGGNNRQ